MVARRLRLLSCPMTSGSISGDAGFGISVGVVVVKAEDSSPVRALKASPSIRFLAFRHEKVRTRRDSDHRFFRLSFDDFSIGILVCCSPQCLYSVGFIFGVYFLSFSKAERHVSIE